MVTVVLNDEDLIVHETKPGASIEGNGIDCSNTSHRCLCGLLQHGSSGVGQPRETPRKRNLSDSHDCTGCIRSRVLFPTPVGYLDDQSSGAYRHCAAWPTSRQSRLLPS